MIAYLPELYPDELVYSWFCRYYIHTCCITHAMAFQEILNNRCNNPSKEFLGHLSNPAEICVESREPQFTNNPLQIAFCEYMAAVFSAPIDLANDIPISAVLYHAMSKTKYMKNSGRSRYTKQFVDDLHNNYKDIASMSQVQRVLLQDRFDFSVICQIAFFLNITVDELTAPKLTDEQIEQEQKTHYIKNRIPVDMAAYDEETEPILKQLANDIYTGAASEIGRPDRESEKLIYRELDLPGHRLEVLPKCKAIMDAYNEPYAECWARRLIWAYGKLKEERNGKPFYWSDVRKSSGVKKKNIDNVIPYLSKHTDKKTADRIIRIIEVI